MTLASSSLKHACAASRACAAAPGGFAFHGEAGQAARLGNGEEWLTVPTYLACIKLEIIFPPCRGFSWACSMLLAAALDKVVPMVSLQGAASRAGG